MTGEGEYHRPRPSYARWQADPMASGRGCRGHRLDRRNPRASSTKRQGVYGRWFPARPATPASTPSTATSVDGRGHQPALIYDQPGHRTKRATTYARLLAEVATLAAVLRRLGVGKGDRVILYMPMIPEAVFAMLACARHRRDPLRRVRRLRAPRNWRRASTTPSRASSSPPPAASSPARRRVQAAARRSDRAVDITSPRPVSCCSGRRPTRR